MQKIKIAYAYLFFFFYSYLNKPKNNLVNAKALSLVLLLELFLIASIFVYATDLHIIDIPSDFNRMYFLVFIIPLVALKYCFFQRNQNGQQYVTAFSNWPEQRQKKWNWIARAIIVFVLANLICSYYWLSEIDWTPYN